MASIYIAGPMTGLPEFNYPAFNNAAQMLRNLGPHVENPADSGVINGATWADYMRLAIAQLIKCDTVYVLNGWESSKGAKLELSIASSIGMKIEFEGGA
jgi:hypothetical protein